MLKRDAAVLLLSALAILTSIQRQGAFSFKPAWHLREPGDVFGDGHEQPLAAPISFDLNGDGRREVIVATEDARIVIVDQPDFEDPSGEWSRAGILWQASLTPTHVRIASGRRAVSITAGYVDPPPAVGAPPRKGIIVVVTAGWSVLAFDHNLRLLWENSLSEEFPPRATVREVAALVTNHSMRTQDRGMVLIGGSVELGDLSGGAEDPLEAPQVQRRWRGVMSPDKHAELDAEEVEGAEAELRSKRGLDRSQHFNYYAFEGRTGARRWRHESSDFHRDTDSMADTLVPQHHYKLDAASLSARHFGEVSCKEFRESVLEVLPHRWTSRTDTRFALAHFARHRHRSMLGGDDKGKSTGKRRDSNKVTGALGRAADAAGLTKGAGTAPAGRPTSHAHALPPNVLVAHLRDGIEAVHLYTGRTMCKLFLPSPELHADINADGVIDHVSAVGWRSDGHAHANAQDRAAQCWATVTTGLPAREQLYNGSICRSLTVTGLGYLGEAHSGSEVAVAPPALLPRIDPSRAGLWRRVKTDTVFLNSRGEVTSFAPDGRRRFQVRVDAGWEVSADGATPTLVPFLLRHGGHAEAVLAAGAGGANVLSPSGVVLVSLPLPAMPLGPMQAMDIDGDGFTDLVVRTRSGVYAWRQHPRPGALPFAFLLGFLVLGAGLAYGAQANAPRSSIKKRSTDAD